MALAEKVHVMNIHSLDLERPMNFGGLSLDSNNGASGNNTYQIDVSTIDELDVKQIDIIKIDVEGMERQVLDGAIKTISRDRPTIVCECNSLDAGNKLLNFFQDKQYNMYGFMAAAYNPNNFNAIKENIFEAGTELALVLLPYEKTAETLTSLADFTLLPINSIEDFVLPLLHKPQYPYEVLAHTAPSSSLGIDFFSPGLKSRDDQIVHLNRVVTNLQEEILQLHLEIETDRSSISWRITKPIRELSLLRRLFIQLMQLYQNYQHKHPGLRGYIQPLRQSLNIARKRGLKKLRNTIACHRRVSEMTPGSEKQFKLLFEAFQQKALDIHPAILFDHNGGGGTNIYTSEMIKNILSCGDSVLRVYPIDEGWVAQWVENNNEMFFTPCIDELFKALSISRGTNIIVNSLYGHPDLNVSTSKIIKLARTLKVTLDIKIHDFNALCPSPHLLDFEGKYCGVPSYSRQ